MTELSTEIHPLFGLAGCLYEKLDSISQLALKRTKIPPAHQDGFNFALEARCIEKYLEEWSVPTNVRYQNIRLIHDTSMAAEAIRWAALIRLYQIMAGEKEDIEKKKQIAVDNILNAVSSIPPGSPANSQLLLPLFMAGLSTASKTKRLQIEYRLSLVESLVALGNISCAHQILDLFWDRKYNGEVDWELLLRVDHPLMLLF
jgi:transcriptional activator protein UGA3